MLERLKKQKEMMAQRQQGAGPQNSLALNTLDNRVRSVESKLNILEDKLDRILEKLVGA